MQITNRQAILFFGGVRKGDYETLLARGFDIIAVIDETWPFALHGNKDFKFIDYKKVLVADAGLIEYIRALVKQYNVKAMLNVVEPFVESYAEVINKLWPVGLSQKAAKNSSNKTIMRQLFAEKIGEQVNARFSVVKNAEQLANFAATINYPVILKPANMYGSKFVTFNDSEQILLQNYHHSYASIKKYFAKQNRLVDVQLLAEEFLQGTNHSVDVAVDSLGNTYPTPVIDVLTGYDIGGEDFCHFARVAPSFLSAEAQQDVSELACAAVQALEITNCVAHVEIIMTPKGPCLLEIGARPGGNRAHILQQTFGIDLMHAYVSVVAGEIPDVTARKCEPFAIVSPYSLREGNFRAINPKIQLETLPTYYRHALKAPLNSCIGPAKLGYFPPISLELKSSDFDLLKRDIEQISSWNDMFIVD